MTSPVPVIDLATGPRRRVVDEVGRANEEVGFLVITGHGVDPALIDAMHEVTEAFFALPLDVKQRTGQPDPAVSRGYVPPFARSLAYSRGEAAPPDPVEYFAIGRLDGRGGAGDVFHRRNLWPVEPAEFADVWTAYYTRLSQLADELLAIFALALDLPADHFVPSCTRHCSVLFANGYPPVAADTVVGRLRLGAHTDYGSLTILYRDERPSGLQVFRDGRWHDVPDVPGSFVVNLGDLLARWTNDRWVSTLHRVAGPAVGDRTRRRLSIPFFHQPDPDALIECLPTCTGPDRPPRYAPITSGENYLHKTRRSLQGTT